MAVSESLLESSPGIYPTDHGPRTILLRLSNRTDSDTVAPRRTSRDPAPSDECDAGIRVPLPRTDFPALRSPPGGQRCGFKRNIKHSLRGLPKL
ncbi:hypothetical protein B0H17DRAFT_1058760 [Mycena rosella]|uniref:Uncharacterized protein n=1 Tax=Mycena rosella TaxID=1033263 RepID=A0AAD7DL69_MYCRO|nr:hypothetical protein B0H17DRAFT_1058760 [Mycena rosella]